MREARHRLRFGEQAFLRAAQIGAEDLQRDEAMQLRVGGLVDDAHAAPADHAPEHVASDPIRGRLVFERHGLHDADEESAGVAAVEMLGHREDLVVFQRALDEGLEARFGRTRHGPSSIFRHVASEWVARSREKLQSILADGRKTWPRIAVEDEVFLEHVESHADRSGDPERYLEGVHGADLYLACGVLHRDRAALAYFEEHFMSKVPSFVLRVRVGRDVVDDVTQKMRELLVMGPSGEPKIGEYSGKGALGGWLRVTAVRTALNQVRHQGAAFPTAEPLGEHLAVHGDPELALVKDRAKALLEGAFQRVVGGLEAKERAMLRLHYIDGLTMDQLSALYKTPRSTVARRIQEVRAQVLEETVTLLRDEGRMTESAVASVLREAQSQLNVTISRLLE